MLTEERRNEIVRMVEQSGSKSVQELMALLKTSESTIRRDLNDLDRKKLLIKVHGGAVALSKTITADSTVSEREDLNRDTKQQLARYAASLITNDDIVYLDAGTTTGFIPDYLTCKNALFVTNAIVHARKLCSLGYQVYMPGGVLKTRTEALTGSQTCSYLEKFHFTKGFFGANGITLKEGFTTPDIQEAAVKEVAVKHTRDRYILCDSSKFDKISSVTFAGFTEAFVITDAGAPAFYKRQRNIVIAPED
ncbi:MAG: DeoR/GlpR family DNA-binding transcription regulator [Lachnospiraceae bacterium]|nr:DeoR/GlpR family DNA-binding transcription regulator [Lachnospiraceae bacterium]